MSFTLSGASQLTGPATNLLYGSTDKKYAVIELNGTTSSIVDTYNVTGVIKASAVVGPLMETINGAVAATASTYATTTITFAGHTGAGVYRGLWLVEQ